MYLWWDPIDWLLIINLFHLYNQQSPSILPSIVVYCQYVPAIQPLINNAPGVIYRPIIVYNYHQSTNVRIIARFIDRVNLQTPKCGRKFVLKVDSWKFITLNVELKFLADHFSFPLRKLTKICYTCIYLKLIVMCPVKQFLSFLY